MRLYFSGALMAIAIHLMFLMSQGLVNRTTMSALVIITLILGSWLLFDIKYEEVPDKSFTIK